MARNIATRARSRLERALRKIGRQGRPHQAVTELEASIAALEQQHAQLLETIDQAQASVRLRREHFLAQYWALYQRPGETPLKARQRFFDSLPPAVGDSAIVQTGLLYMLDEFDKLCRANGIGYWLAAGALIGAVRTGNFIPWDDDADVFMMEEDYHKLEVATEGNPHFYLQRFVRSSAEQAGSVKYIMRFRHRQKGIKRCFVDIFLCAWSDKGDDETADAMARFRKRLRTDYQDFRKQHPELLTATRRQADDIVFEFLKPYEEKQRELFAPDNKQAFVTFLYTTNHRTGKRSIWDRDVVFPLKEIDFAGRKLLGPAKPYEFVVSEYNGGLYDLPRDMFGRHVRNAATSADIVAMRNFLVKRGYLDAPVD
ncbi:MAG: LicD family protein [Propionibacteriaceae bacterium]|jgi:phosphorylcholine metabolism protein LicD|nr:LicD family protein [Propionibacteriaceae bacterium]